MIKVLVVGTGRDGTLSLTKWFNELFESNHIQAQAAHEYLAGDSYNAFDEYCKTNNEKSLQSIINQCFQSPFEVIIGNGYANLLPYFAQLSKDIILIHLERRDRDACIASHVNNAKYFPFAYKYYVPEELVGNDIGVIKYLSYLSSMRIILQE